MDLIESYSNCVLCPRLCGVNRTRNCPDTRTGFCGETDQLRVAYVGPHFGEEPPISGTNGSGAIFFTGCSLKCSFCQNHQISQGGVGTVTGLKKMRAKIVHMIEEDRVHNINFVTPDHFFPHLFRLVHLLRLDGFDLPIVYNLSGFQSVESLKSAENHVDIFLPDFKYSDASLAGCLSRCNNYSQIALEAIAEMVTQKDFLDASLTGAPLATRGVLVRHLILPGQVENSINALTTLFVEFGPGLPLSLMSQYHPIILQRDADLNRTLSKEEFDRVYMHAQELGFKNLFVQFPDKRTIRDGVLSPFLPDFESLDPFPARRSV